MRKITSAVGLLAVVAVTGVTALTWSGANEPSTLPSAKALEAALLAPCCWNGTLATHDSPLAAELREEIEGRSARGESTSAIRSDLVGRYGGRIDAMPRVGAFTNALVLAFDVLIVASAALFLALWRWRKDPRSREPAPTSPPAGPTRDARDPYDDRIEAELAALGED